jgi:hypothetical protein
MSNVDLFLRMAKVTDLSVTITDDGFYVTDFNVDPNVQHWIGDTPTEAAKWLAYDHLDHCLDFNCNCVELTDPVLAANEPLLPSIAGMEDSITDR